MWFTREERRETFDMGLVGQQLTHDFIMASFTLKSNFMPSFIKSYAFVM